MTVGDFVLIVAIVLLIAGFTGLLIALIRVGDSLEFLRSEMQMWRNEVTPLVEKLRESTDDARSVMEEARSDLSRFDKVLGSAEAISEAVEGSAKVTRAALSTPVIKVASFATGTSRAARRLRSSNRDSKRKRSR